MIRSNQKNQGNEEPASFFSAFGPTQKRRKFVTKCLPKKVIWFNISECIGQKNLFLAGSKIAKKCSHHQVTEMIIREGTLQKNLTNALRQVAKSHFIENTR